MIFLRFLNQERTGIGHDAPPPPENAAYCGGMLDRRIAIGLAIPRTTHVASSSSSAADRLDRTTSRSPGRNVFSPDIRNDQHVRREQLKVVELLEQQCRTTHENCDLAKASRQALTRN
jgi:hypothetical protein